MIGATKAVACSTSAFTRRAAEGKASCSHRMRCTGRSVFQWGASTAIDRSNPTGGCAANNVNRTAGSILRQVPQGLGDVGVNAGAAITALAAGGEQRRTDGNVESAEWWTSCGDYTKNVVGGA